MRGTPWRWPLWLVALGLAVAFAGLALARYLPDRQFLYGLLLTGAGLGIAVVALVVLLLGRRILTTGVTGLVAFLLAGAAAGLRLALMASRPEARGGAPLVVMWREILLGVPFTLAVAALALGAHAAGRTIALPPGGLASRAAKADLVTSILGLAGGLYTLGPLLTSFGFPLNHWTFLGLVGLGLAAFLVVTLLERLFGGGKRKTRK